MIKLLFDGPRRASLRLALAHGAGAGMESPFMTEIAADLGARGIRVARFEFPYMQRQRAGKRTAPDRLPILLETWSAVVAQLGAADGLVIGGKSMGGRIASMIADESKVRGVICLGYPFHPPGKPTQLRTAHLEKLKTSCLIVQGTRDTFGTREDVQQYALSKRIALEWIEDGDHSLMVRKKMGQDPKRARVQVLDRIEGFLKMRARGK
jgi:predicted alpha/beta-hydrolase family hydrolase